MPYTTETAMKDALIPLVHLQLNTIHGQVDVIDTITKKFSYFVDDVENIPCNNPSIRKTLYNLTAELIRNTAKSLKRLKQTGDLTGLNTDLNIEMQQAKITVQLISQQQEPSAATPWMAFLKLLTWLQSEIIKNLNLIKKTSSDLTIKYKTESADSKGNEDHNDISVYCN